MPGPKKETARIAVLPAKPAAGPAVQMKKTQPLVTMPEPAPPTVPLTVTPAEPVEATAEEIPMAFCWALLGVSAIILIIQIWNYFV